jgi:Mycobacterium membrane protein
VKGIPILRVLQRVWIPLVIVLVGCVGAFAVVRVHGIFGSEKRPSYSDSASDDSKPFNPKIVTYEITGPPGTVADISYFDADAEPKRVDNANLHADGRWSVSFPTTSAAVMGNIVAQGNSDWLQCRILVDGVQKAIKRVPEVNAFTYCVLKGA